MSTLNINIGLLGHVDSGKTSLAKKLSQIGSTAAFDKSKQSQERGITLDLGFSALVIPMPENLKNRSQAEELQLTFVDCPGHASLLKTIIGGAQIIDFIILVIDVTKGIQTQTAECLVIGEITCAKNLIVALNKIDLLEESKRKVLIDKMTRKLSLVLSTTSFSNAKIIPLSVLTGEGLNNFVMCLKEILYIPERDSSCPFLFAVDHCFQITGQGTICTGTVLQGKIGVNDDLEIPKLKIIRKVKSMQMFRKSIKNALQGDRIGICLTQFNESQMERGILASPGYLNHAYVCVLKIKRIKYFKHSLKTNSKLHISVGHETVMGKVLFFESNQEKPFSIDNDYQFLNEIDPITESSESNPSNNIYVVIEFDKPVLITIGMLIIASQMNEAQKNVCRLAFYGHVDSISDDRNYEKTFLSQLKIYKEIYREGNVQRIVNNTEIIVVNLFKKESNRSMFIGLKVELNTGEHGVIESTFGQTNKVKVRFNIPLGDDTLKKIEGREVKVGLRRKKYIFDKTNKIRQ